MRKLLLKIFSFVMMACFLLSPLTACKTNGNALRLSEVTHSIFYAPLYIAIEKGYFEDEGIELELTNDGGADKVMTSLVTGASDIGLMGPEATVYVQAGGTTNYPIIFGQLTNCDGAFLIGRNQEPDFSWASMRGKKLIAGRAGGMPAMTLQYVIEQAGVSLDEMDFITSIEFNMMGAAFAGNTEYDFVTLFEPAASALLAEGGYYRLRSIGQDSGAVPYTTFSATKNFMDKNPQTIKAFLRAIMKGYDYLINNDMSEVARTIEPSFPGTDLTIIENALNAYKSINAWKETPVMKKEDFELLQTIMQNAGTLPNKVSFTDIVDNTIASELVAELKK